MENHKIDQVVMERLSSVMIEQLGKRISTPNEVEVVEKFLVSSFQEILKKSKKDDLIHSYSVEVVKDSPEIELIREVMEEPKDLTKLEFNVSMQLNAKIDYIYLEFPLDKKL